MTDREVYPAILGTLGILAIFYLVWKYMLGEPTIAACWVWQNWQVYCPACGGTRALIALVHGRLLQSFYYNPMLPITTIWTTAYLLSQTIWRLRGRRGWALHYDPRLPGLLTALLLINCAVRNVLWLGFEIGI